MHERRATLLANAAAGDPRILPSFPSYLETMSSGEARILAKAYGAVPAGDTTVLVPGNEWSRIRDELDTERTPFAVYMERA